MSNRDAEAIPAAPEAEAPTGPPGDPQVQIPEKIDVNSIKQEAMGRLQKLLNEYETLEIKEDKLLKLLEKIRGEEGHLQRALEDPLWDGLPSSRQTTNASASNDDSNWKAKSNSNTKASNAIDPEHPSNFATTTTTTTRKAVGTATPQNPATPAFPQHTTITTQPIHKQQQSTTTQASNIAARNVKTNSIRQLQQQREQRVLARQKLEDSLLNDDDDASSSSGIDKNVAGMQPQQQHLTKQQLSPDDDSTTNAGGKRKRQEPQHQSQRKKTGIQLQKEQRILERQRLEDALLGDGNSDSDDSDNDSPAIVYV